MIRPKSAPSRGLALGHGSARLQSSRAVCQSDHQSLREILKTFGSLAPPVSQLRHPPSS